MNVTVYNRTVPVFNMKLDAKGSVVEIGKMLNADLAPIILKNNYNLANVKKWMKRRRMPDKREGLAEVNRLFANIPEARNRFSLSDQYWFHCSEADTWEGMNYFTNTYSPDYGLMFFSPWNVDEKNLSESPDMTTNGGLRKRWKQASGNEDDLTSYLVKCGAENRAQLPVNEVLASITLKKVGLLPSVEYSLTVEGLEICSICRNFVTAETEFVSAYEVFEIEPWDRTAESEYEHFVRMCLKVGMDEKTVRDYMDRMMTCDYIICNVDRHLTNFGFIRSAMDGRILSFAPLFDSGNAFFGDETKSEVSFPEIRKGAVQRVLGTAVIDPGIFDKILDEAEDIVDMCIDLTRKDKVEILDKMSARFNSVKAIIGEKIKEEQELELGA